MPRLATPVTVPPADAAKLRAILRKGTHKSRKIARARALLAMGAGQGAAAVQAEAGISARQYYRLKGRYLGGGLAQALEERAEFRDVQFVYALTIFAGVLGPMGFQSQALPDVRQARVMAIFFNLLRVLYGAKNTDSQQLLPAVIWMSRSTLLARYGAHRRNTPQSQSRLELGSTTVEVNP